MAGKRVNIAISGGPCTGKTVLAASLFAKLKMESFDYDLILEQGRQLKAEFGHYRSPFERFYMWRQQEREELRSIAANGFITDTALFQYYAHARQYASEPRDKLAIRELYRMCLELEDRYQLIILAENYDEIKYKTDSSRSSGEDSRKIRHNIIRSFVEHLWPEKVLLVHGEQQSRLEQATKKIIEIHNL